MVNHWYNEFKLPLNLSVYKKTCPGSNLKKSHSKKKIYDMNYPSPFVCKIFLSLGQEVLEQREKNKDSKKFYITNTIILKKKMF